MQVGDAEAVASAQREALADTISMLKSISASNPICDGEQVMYDVLPLSEYQPD